MICPTARSRWVVRGLLLTLVFLSPWGRAEGSEDVGDSSAETDSCTYEVDDLGAFDVIACGSVVAESFAVGGSIVAAEDADLRRFFVGHALGAEAYSVLSRTAQLRQGTVGGRVGVLDPDGSTRAGTVRLTSFDEVAVDLEGLCSSIEGLSLSYGTPSLEVTHSDPWDIFELWGDDPTENVFVVESTELNDAVLVDIDVPAGSRVRVDVLGDTIDLNHMGFFVAGATPDAVLFNFREASTVRLNGVGVLGSVLAPYAQVELTTSMVEGAVWSAGLDGHNFRIEHGPPASGFGEGCTSPDTSDSGPGGGIVDTASTGGPGAGTGTGGSTCTPSACNDDDVCTIDVCTTTADGEKSCAHNYDPSMEGVSCFGDEWAIYCSGDGVCGEEYDLETPNSCPSEWCSDGNECTEDVCFLVDTEGGFRCENEGSADACGETCLGDGVCDSLGTCQWGVSAAVIDCEDDGGDGECAADLDEDGVCDDVDTDDDGDGVEDDVDSDDRDPFRCVDTDEDGCDDCVSGTFDPSADGVDSDGDGSCDGGDVCVGDDSSGDLDEDGVCDDVDTDDDGDGVEDDVDSDDRDRFRCVDTDEDGCDDCVSGTFDPSADGVDSDGDGSCDSGDVCVGDDSSGDLDEDGVCDDVDTDDDGDGVEDDVDSDDRDRFRCVDTDEDGCDDCVSGTFDPSADGVDSDGDGSCDSGDVCVGDDSSGDLDEDGVCDDVDTDDDGDGVEDDVDSDDRDRFRCVDTDEDGCDDCVSGTFDPSADGVDSDGDGSCDSGDVCVGDDSSGDLDEDGVCDDVDTDDDGDGVEDDVDSDDRDPFRCVDTDEDGCDDCVSGTFDPSADGVDSDGDGSCDSGDVCVGDDSSGDLDEDGVCDDVDTDDDGDGVEDDVDSDDRDRSAA